MATPYVTIVRDVVSSTQDLAAAALADAGRVSLVVAHEQTAGRGRTGNPWWQATRAAAASLALPAELREVDQTFPLGVGLAVREAIHVHLGREVGLKWPNDIVCEGAKVGGILVEARDGMLVVGCGLNLFWPDPPDGAGALCGNDPGADLGLRLSRAWADYVLSDEFAWDRDSYLAACETLGSTIEWEPNGAGLAVGIDADGGLIVDTAQGRLTLHSGEVRTVRYLSDGA
jgi:BirA family biotin operon repressor/biotin-[acetyl-CoA-carboxylase] ligase